MVRLEIPSAPRRNTVVESLPWFQIPGLTPYTEQGGKFIDKRQPASPDVMITRHRNGNYSVVLKNPQDRSGCVQQAIRIAKHVVAGFKRVRDFSTTDEDDWKNLAACMFRAPESPELSTEDRWAAILQALLKLNGEYAPLAVRVSKLCPLWWNPRAKRAVKF